jgi:hypothetical protein
MLFSTFIAVLDSTQSFQESKPQKTSKSFKRPQKASIKGSVDFKKLQ